jgi:hypothetical protein
MRPEIIPKPTPAKKPEPEQTEPESNELPSGEEPPVRQEPGLEGEDAPTPPAQEEEPKLPPEMGGELPQVPGSDLGGLVAPEEPPKPEKKETPEPPAAEIPDAPPEDTSEPGDPKKIPDNEDPFKDDPMPETEDTGGSTGVNRKNLDGPKLGAQPMHWRPASRFRPTQQPEQSERSNVVVDAQVMRASATTPIKSASSSSLHGNPLRSGGKASPNNPLRAGR